MTSAPPSVPIPTSRWSTSPTTSIDYKIDSTEAYDTARYMLLDSLGTAMLAMKFPECVKHMGPVVPGATLPGGARVPGTSHELDPVQAAFAIGTQIRWLDFNDTWLAAEWGHPSDNLGSILAVADYLGRKAEREGGQPLTVRDVLTHAIKAHEIQGCYALRNASIASARTTWSWCAWRPRRSPRRCSVAPRSRSSTPCRIAGSTTVCCAPIATRPMPARARAGLRAMPAAAP